MEGNVRTSCCSRFAIVVLWALALSGVGAVFVRDLRAQSAEEEGGQISLQRSVTAREYNGKSVEGQEWAVGQGDSLWRILIQERGLSEKRFGQYLSLIRRLNPQMKTADVLRVGDKVFIPLRPDEMLGTQTVPAKTETAQVGKGATRDYTIKQGDSLLRVLKEQLGVADEKKLSLYFNLTKDLNPQKKNWDILQAGETIRLPALGTAAEVSSQASGPAAKERSDSLASGQPGPVTAPESKTASEIRAAAPPSMGLDYARQLPARENLALLGQAVETVGNEIQRSGQEVIAIKNGAIRIDTSSFPMVYNRKLDQRILLDADEKIPDSLRSQLNDRASGTPVMTVSKNTSVQEAVSQLLARLGYQSLPRGQAVILQEGGLTFEAKGQWVVLAPQESDKPQEVYVINLTAKTGEVPEYLRSYLALKGLHLKEILWPPSLIQSAAFVVLEQPRAGIPQAKTLPRDKREIVDELLLSYGISYGGGQTLSAELREGLKIEAQCDRVFEWRGQQTALFFQRVEPDIKKALQDRQGIKTIEMDLSSVSSRDLIGKLLSELGDPAPYREHRFPAASGMMQDRLVIVASGFLLPKRSTFVTDREIPEEFQRFFFEKGLEIVYFQ
jgi:hypothetical protein